MDRAYVDLICGCLCDQLRYRFAPLLHQDFMVYRWRGGVQVCLASRDYLPVQKGTQFFIAFDDMDISCGRLSLGEETWGRLAEFYGRLIAVSERSGD